MKIVSDWRDAWRWLSMWAGGVLAALPAVWVQLPPDIKGQIPVEWMPAVSAVMFAAFVAARLKAQE